MGDSGQAEVGAAVVKARAINVVDDETGGDIFYELAVHKDAGEFTIRFANRTLGVEGVFTFCFAYTPIVVREGFIILGVNDGEKAPGQRYSPEGTAVAQAAIEDDGVHKDALKPGRDLDCKGQLDGAPPPRMELIID